MGQRSRSSAAARKRLQKRQPESSSKTSDPQITESQQTPSEKSDRENQTSVGQAPNSLDEANIDSNNRPTKNPAKRLKFDESKQPHNPHVSEELTWAKGWVIPRDNISNVPCENENIDVLTNELASGDGQIAYGKVPSNTNITNAAIDQKDEDYLHDLGAFDNFTAASNQTFKSQEECEMFDAHFAVDHVLGTVGDATENKFSSLNPEVIIDKIDLDSCFADPKSKSIRRHGARKRKKSMETKLREKRQLKRKLRLDETPERRDKRIVEQSSRQARGRQMETAGQRIQRLNIEATRQQKSRRNESDQHRSERLRAQTSRQETSRNNESLEQRAERLRTQASRQETSRNNESAEDCIQRLQYQQNYRKRETPERASARLANRRMKEANQRMNEAQGEREERLQHRRQNYQRYLKQLSTVEQLRVNIRQKTTENYKCCSCKKYCALGNIKKHILEADLKTDFWKLRKPLLTLTEDTKCYGSFHLCSSCYSYLSQTEQSGDRLGKPKIPPCNEATYQYEVPTLPKKFQDNPLNKCEQNLLKLVIPFIKVYHIPRSNQLKVVGPCLNVEADIASSLEKIIPVEQQLIPVALKRMPNYQGHYTAEMVDKKKLLEYFAYFKLHNPLFKDVEFDSEKLNEILAEVLEEVETQDEFKTTQQEAGVNLEQQDADDDEELLDDSSEDEGEMNEIADVNDEWTEYDAPDYQTVSVNDTVIDPLTRNESMDTLSESIAKTIIEGEQALRQRQKSFRNSNRQERIEVAPTQAGKFVDFWDKTDENAYLTCEEACFPELFPAGTGGFLSTHQKHGCTFANYVKQRIFGIDPRFRENETYVFFLYVIKEQLEINRSVQTYFRKGKLKKNRYTVDFLRGCEKKEIERYDIKFKAFQAVRGTDPYFEQQKLRLMAMIRQLGAPHLFLTLSAAEIHWNDLIRDLLRKEFNRAYTDEEIGTMSKTFLNALVNKHTIFTTKHFSHRIKKVFEALKKPGILGDYKVVNFFYRVEYQQRGSPHIHSVLWLEDEDGNPAPTYDKKDPSSKAACEAFIDSIISARTLPDDNPLAHKVSFFQTHDHTFTCRKKSRKVVIGPKEGHGKYDGIMEGDEITTCSCRFKFPKFPMLQTTIIESPREDTDDEDLAKWKHDYDRVRKYLLRHGTNPTQEFLELSYDEFLDRVGLGHQEYVDCLKMSVSRSKRGAMVMLEREVKDIFINNYNENLLSVHSANMDIQFILDEYACVQYICGYIAKAESGFSRLLQQIEDESARFGLTPTQKMSQLSRALDRSREVSRPEAVYRMLGLPMTQSSLRAKFLQTGDPDRREGLIRSNLQELDKDDNPFCNTAVDYYQHRPDQLERLSLAEFWRDYDVMYESSQQRSHNCLYNEDHVATEYVGNRIALKKGANKKPFGYIKKRTKAAIVRYYINKRYDSDMMRDLLVLFKPFRDENVEIHSADIEALYEENKDSINVIWDQFEPNRDQYERMEKAIDAGRDDIVDTDDDEYEYNSEDETTTDKELANFEKLLRARTTNASLTDIPTIKAVCEEVRKLNDEQRMIFDDTIERIVASIESDQDDMPAPAYTYLSGAAGTGKTTTMRAIINAATLLLLKSGDDLSKPTVLRIAPTGTAAHLIGGDTIDGALDLFGSKEHLNKNKNLAALRFKYSQLRLIIIDEISMVGSKKLQDIHDKLCNIMYSPDDKHGRKAHDHPFGGIPIICTGDFRQLKAIGEEWIFNNCVGNSRAGYTAPNHWKLHFKIFDLEQKMRSVVDVPFSELCDKIGSGDITDHERKMLESRVIECPIENENKAYTEGRLLTIVIDNNRRETINREKLNLLEGEQFTFEAEDKAANIKQKSQDKIDKMTYTQTRGLPKSLTVKINAPVLLTSNIDKTDGLTNGVRGYVVRVDSSEESPCIWVKFPKGIGEKTANNARHKHNFNTQGAVPIRRIRETFSVSSNYGKNQCRNRGRESDNIRVSRKQFPLVLAYATTAHKAQGMTVDNVIIDFTVDGKEPAKVFCGSFYVAITRARRLEKVFLKAFHDSMIKTDKSVAKEMDRMHRNAKYEFSKRYLRDNVFEEPPPGCFLRELKLVYLNINGLMDSDHIEDLRNDKNLLHADVICIAETKLPEEEAELNEDYEVPDSKLELNDFRIIYRQQVKKGKMGMIIYAKNRSHLEIEYTTSWSSEKVEIVQYIINEHPITFLYFHPDYTVYGLQKLANDPHELIHVRVQEILMGDFNLDWYNTQKRRTLSSFTESQKLAIAGNLGPTHSNRTWIDHVLYDENLDDITDICTQSYKNLYSDHKAITVRVGDIITLPDVVMEYNLDTDTEVEEMDTN